MKTIFKYLFYLVLIAVLYIVISAMYDGKINGSSTVNEVEAQISSGIDKMASDTVDAVEKITK